MTLRTRMLSWMCLAAVVGTILVACGRSQAGGGPVDGADPEAGGGAGIMTGPETALPPGSFGDTSPRLDPGVPSATFPPTPASTPTPETAPPTAAATSAPLSSPEPETGDGQPATTSSPTLSSEDTLTPTPTGAEERIHIVVDGENLYRIGLLYGLSWVAIAEYNGLSDPDQISVGQELRIPPSPTATSEAATPDGATPDGATPDGATPDAATPEVSNPNAEVAAARAAEPDRPANPPPSPDESGEEVVRSASVAVYQVNPGDTLYSISARYGINWTQVAEANGLSTPNQIFAGQVLKIPADVPGPPPVFSHQVHAGETLARIAAQYGLALEELAEANGLSAPYVIYRGQVLSIPER